jgi:hypothetical protein
VNDDTDDEESTGSEELGPDEGGEGAAGTAPMEEREAVADDTDDLFPGADDDDRDPDGGDGDADRGE